MDAAVASACATANPKDFGEHFGHIVEEISKSIDDQTKRRFASATEQVRQEVVNEIARKHVLRTVREIPLTSRTIQSLLDSSAVAIIGAMYDTQTGKTEFMYASAIGPIAKSAQITESTNAHA
jgi:carbonic anhydrase